MDHHQHGPSLGLGFSFPNEAVIGQLNVGYTIESRVDVGLTIGSTIVEGGFRNRTGVLFGGSFSALLIKSKQKNQFNLSSDISITRHDEQTITLLGTTVAYKKSNQSAIIPFVSSNYLTGNRRVQNQILFTPGILYKMKQKTTYGSFAIGYSIASKSTNYISVAFM